MEQKVLLPIAIAFTLGGGLGYLIASKIAEAHWQEIAHDEIEDVKSYYQKKYESEEAVAEVDEKMAYRKLAREYVKPSPSEVVRRATAKDILEDDEEEEPEEEIEEVEEVEVEQVEELPEKQPEPFLIGYEDFIFDNNYDKIDLYYYRFDDVVCDVNDRVYVHPEDQLGEQWLKDLKKKTMTFVRNDQLEIDYEIHSLSKSYNEEVAIKMETDTERRFRQIARQKEAMDTMSDEFIQADAELKRKGEKKKAAYTRKKSNKVAYNQIPLADEEDE